MSLGSLGRWLARKFTTTTASLVLAEFDRIGISRCYLLCTVGSRTDGARAPGMTTFRVEFEI